MSSQKSRQYTETDKFLAVFPEIVSSAVTRICIRTNTQTVGPWLKELLEYNSPGGNKCRGLLTVAAYEMLEEPGKITDGSLHRARIVGWCVELLQTGLILQDDIMDNSSTRRGSVCWYRLPHVGQRAINDSSVLICVIYDTLKHYLGKYSCYAYIFEQFNEAMLSFSVGQHMDYTTLKKYDLFTMENYNIIASTKMSHVSINFPARCGLLLTNHKSNEPFKILEGTSITTDIGILIMMQNDFRDCFGDEDVAGKAGTDIQEGKCTWLAVTALQLFNPAQRAEFEECYGSSEEGHVQRVKQLYRDIQLPQLYHATDKLKYENIVRRIKALPSDNAMTRVILAFLDSLYSIRSSSK